MLLLDGTVGLAFRATAELGYELLICLVQYPKAQKHTAHGIFKKPMNTCGKHCI